jgi:hypothetical protein
MNLLKLNTIAISTVALMGVEAALATPPKPIARPKPVADALVPNTSAMAKMAQAAPKVQATTRTYRAAPLVKRGILLSVGQANPSTGDITSNLESDGYTKTQVAGTSDAKTFAIGYRQPLGRHWSVDVTYIDQGEISATVEAAPSGSINPAKDVALALPIYGSGLNYAGLRHFPLGRGINAHAGAGIFIYDNERKATIDGDTHIEKDKGVKPMAQLGISYAATPRVSVELTAQRFFMPGDDVDRLSLGVSVGF